MSSLFNPFEEGRQGQLQAGRELGDISKAQITLAPLDRSHKRAVDAAFVGETLLRVASLGAQFPYSLPQRF
jgi:hypothetical protein